MIVSTTTEYALRALANLAQLPEGERRQGQDVSRQCGIPVNYTAKILWTLSKSGLVAAVRGAGGGYQLAKPAKQIRLKEVITVIEGFTSAPHGLHTSRHIYRGEKSCLTHHAWRKVLNAYLKFIETRTLADICAKQPVISRKKHGRTSPLSSRRTRAAVLLGVLLVFSLSASAADEGEQLYKQACVGCHTIGGSKLVGPDLLNVSGRQTREWLTQFIRDPKKVIDSGDAHAQQMVKEANNLVMPSNPGLSDAQVASIIDYIDGVSQKGGSATVAAVVVPATPEDERRGQDLFEGKAVLHKGGPSCISCHAVSGLFWGGGGRLGPDLTQVASRLGGSRGLSGWLTAPGTPIMRSVFAEHPIEADEVRSLTAYLVLAASEARPSSSVANRAGILYFIALVVAITVLMVISLLWKDRIHSVRKSLTAKFSTPKS